MIKKQFLKNRPVCKTTFSVAEDAFPGKKIGVVGQFNNWNVDEPIKMTKKKDGTYSASVDLPVGKNIEFRYVADNNWINDDQADGYVATPFGSQNCVVSTAN